MRPNQRDFEREGRSPEGICSASIRRLTQVGALYIWVVTLPRLLLGCGDGGEIEVPQPLYGAVPIEYPMDLWDAEVQGLTMLRVRVTETGAVDSVEVIEASGYPAFDSAAVRGALKLEYRPATRDGNRITVWAKVPVHFTIGGETQ